MPMEHEPLHTRLGRRLREARVNAGFTVREAALRAGIVSHSLLVRYENSHAHPPPGRLEALANAYGTTVAALHAEHDEAVALIAVIDRADITTLQRLLAALR
jgi:transcriptional regulator with XRE-family HTH domain